METFHLPLHEIYARFTKSELYMFAWRSQEQHHFFKTRMARSEHDLPPERGNGKSRGRKDHYGPNDVVPAGLPDHFFNEDGEVDLSQVTGFEAHKYMAQIGMPMPVMQTNKPNPSKPRPPHARS